MYNLKTGISFLILLFGSLGWLASWKKTVGTIVDSGMESTWCLNCLDDNHCYTPVKKCYSSRVLYQYVTYDDRQYFGIAEEYHWDDQQAAENKVNNELRLIWVRYFYWYPKWSTLKDEWTSLWHVVLVAMLGIFLSHYFWNDRDWHDQKFA